MVAVKADLEQIYAKGIRLTPEAFDFLQKSEVSERVFQKILSAESPFLTKETLDDFISLEEKIPTQATVSRAAEFKPIAKEFQPRFKIIGQSDITGKSNCTGKLEDFVGHFRNRFERISQILRARVTPNALVKTNKLKDSQGAKVRLLAMITEKRVTKKGN